MNAATKTAVDWAAIWPLLEADMQKIAIMSMDWQRQLLANGDLASNILKFAETVRQETFKNGC